jgi:hypothetical protein
VLGQVRYMSSRNTVRKFRLGPYLDYVETLPTIDAVRGRGKIAALAGKSRFGPCAPLRGGTRIDVRACQSSTGAATVAATVLGRSPINAAEGLETDHGYP